MSFEGEYFGQIDGVAMGSPLGPLLADVFMAHVENLSEDLIGNMSLYKRYVDDILVIGERKENINCLLIVSHPTAFTNLNVCVVTHT